MKLTLLDEMPQDLCWKGKVAYLAFQLQQYGNGKEIPVGHIFKEGAYWREARYPANCYIIGREHKIGHECRLLEGSVILCGEGSRVRIDAPYAIKTNQGFQMVVYTLTPIVAVTIHPNPEGSRNIDELEDKWFMPEVDTLELGKAVHLRLAQKSCALEVA